MKSAENTRLDAFLLAAVTLLAAWLRFLHAGQPSLWWDEFITVGSSLRPLADMLNVLKHIGPSDIGVELFPPLTHVLTHCLLQFGRSDTLVRLPELLAGTALIPATWFLCRKPLGRLSAHAACLLLALSVYHIHYSREVRPYSLFLLENALALHFLYAALSEGRKRLLWAWGTAVATMLYTSYMAATLIFAQAVFAGAFLARQWAVGRRREALVLGARAALALCLAGILYLPWAEGQIVIYKALHDPTFKVKFTLEFIASALREFAAFADRSEFPNGWLLLTLALAGFGASLSRKRRTFASMMVLWAFMPVLGIFLAKARMELSSRYLVTVFYFLMVFAGHFLAMVTSWLGDRLFGGTASIPVARVIAIGFLGVLVSTPNLASLPEYYSRETSDYKNFVRFLSENANNQDFILFYNPRNQKLIYDWYGKGDPKPVKEIKMRGYLRALMLAPEGSLAKDELPLAIQRNLFNDVDLFGMGIARTPVIPMVPDSSGTFFYSDDYSGDRALEEAEFLCNVTPSPYIKSLTRYDAGQPAQAIYSFTTDRGSSLRSVRLALTVSAWTEADIPTNDSLTVSLLLRDRQPVRLAVLNMASFLAPDGSLVPADSKHKRFARLDLDLSNQLAGTEKFELALEWPNATRAGAIELEDLRLDAQMDGPIPPREALPLALLAQIAVTPWIPSQDLILSDAVHAFSLDGGVTGPNVGTQELLKAYLAAHPGDKPVRVLPYPGGTPAVALYDPALADPWLRLAAGEVRTVTASPATEREVRSVKLSGALANPELSLGKQRLSLPVSCPAPARLTVNPGRDADLVFSPLFSAKEFDPAAFSESGNVRRNPVEDCLSCAEDGDCSVTYAMRSGLPVSWLHITAFPRVNSDPQGLNRIRTLVSCDNGPWRQVNEYSGSGSGRWEGWKIPQYSMVKLDRPAREVKVRFELTGQAQLWSSPDARMRLSYRLDASGLAVPRVDSWPVSLGLANSAPLEIMLLGKPQSFPDHLLRTR